MFTGIVTAVGRIQDVSPQPGQSGPEAGVRLTIAVTDFLRADTRIGDSIAIEGACMTVVDIPSRRESGQPDSVTAQGSDDGGRKDVFIVDVSRESLNRTTGLECPGPVNLEHAMRLGDTLDGHLVSGHVDGLGTVRHMAPVGESWDLRIHVPADLARYMAYKGSITVNGVSLTVNQVDDLEEGGCEVRINLIPHTIQVTTLQHLQVGDAVNLEVDMIARYVERILSAGAHMRPGT